jgi:hypothetical protein
MLQSPILIKVIRYDFNAFLVDKSLSLCFFLRVCYILEFTINYGTQSFGKVLITHFLPLRCSGTEATTGVMYQPRMMMSVE